MFELVDGVAQCAEADAVYMGEQALCVCGLVLCQCGEDGAGCAGTRGAGCFFIFADSEVKASGAEVGQGGEGLWRGVTRFERAQIYAWRVWRAFNTEQEIDSGGDDAGAAEGAGSVVVVQDEYGDVGGLGEVAHAVEEGLQGEGGILVTAANDIGQGIDDDEAGVDGLRGLHEGLEIIGLAQIKVGERHVMEGCLGRGGVAVEGGMDARPEAWLASLFIYEQDGALVDGAAEPGFAEGGADGKV